MYGIATLPWSDGLAVPSGEHRGAPAIVAIPVKDEATHIADCLRAVARRQDCGLHEILLLLNNCIDGTEAVVRDLAPRLPVRVHILVAHLPPDLAHAGHARHLAMQCAADRVASGGVLLTTDADGRVAPDWVAANLAAIARGAEAVAGQAVIDPLDAQRIPAHLHADDGLECAYAERLDEIDCLVDPDPADPWPRHSEASGASIAVTLAAYRRAGGVPAVPLGEDRAFLARLRRVDAAIRHAPGVRVVVSGRIHGRAQGGMADTMRRRIIRQDASIDDRLEPAALRLLRARLRARFRAVRADGRDVAGLARALQVEPAWLETALPLPFVGQGWETIEAQSPVLRQTLIARAALAEQTAAADAILARLRPERIGRDARPVVAVPRDGLTD